MTEIDRQQRIDAYREQSRMADDLANAGKTDEALVLLRQQLDVAAAHGDDDYRLFFESEIIHYTSRNFSEQIKKLQQALSWLDENNLPKDWFFLRTLGICFDFQENFDEAIALFDQALSIKPDDYDVLRQKGVSLSNLGREDEAIALYDQALSIKPDDYDALRNKGVSLSKLGREDEAIALYDQALSIKPDDYDALRGKGVSLNNSGDFSNAIALYNQALDINPNDAKAYRERAISKSNIGQPENAWDDIKQAAKLSPEKYKEDFRFLAGQLDKDPDAEWLKLTDEEPATGEEREKDRLTDIRSFVSTIRKALGQDGHEFLEQIQEANDKEVKFLQPDSLLDPELSITLILRKWNSYTPALPTSEDERSRGGGYFIYHNGKGTVVDPGYNFIENFFEAGCRICDIDNIVITHAHNDHTIDFESICTLLYKFNAQARDNDQPEKKATVYMNNGAFKKFSGLLNLRDHTYIETHVTLNKGNRYTLDGDLTLDVLPAYHDELVARDQAVGLLFTLSFDEEERKVLFTGDTGLFPLEKDGSKITPNTEEGELWREYPATAYEVDLMIAHIGSINEKEIKGKIGEGLDKCLYPNHLGVIGATRMIDKIAPKVAVVSEFGEEMRQFRCALTKQMQTFFVDKKSGARKSVILPGDLALVYGNKQGQVLCCADRNWIDAQNVKYDYADGKMEHIFYFSEDSEKTFQKEFRKFELAVKAYLEARAKRKGGYFKEQ